MRGLSADGNGLGAAEINRAMLPGEWSEHGVDYCPVTQHPLDDVIRALEDAGFSPQELASIEYLSDPDRQSGKSGASLDYCDRDDVSA